MQQYQGIQHIKVVKKGMDNTYATVKKRINPQIHTDVLYNI